MTGAGQELHRAEQDLKGLSDMLRSLALGTNRVGDALTFARLYGRLHWDNISGFFGDEAFEAQMFARWQDRNAPPVTRSEQGDRWCHVLTRLYASGGHSRLFRLLAQGLADRGIPQSVVVMDKAAPSVMGALGDHLEDQIVLRGTRLARAQAMYRTARTARVVVLHNDPDDIATALVARALQRDGVRVLFVNHADHVFSFGPGAADLTLEICATGWRTTAERRGARAQAFMGIPMVAADHVVPTNAGDRSGPILSIGGGGKYRPTENLNFPEFLVDLLSRVPNSVELIGLDGSDPWWSQVKRKHPGRVTFHGVQPPEFLQNAYTRASCYVDSFPMDGGTVFSEAVMNGVPTFGPNRGDALGISPADALRCSDVVALTAQVAEYLQGAPDTRDMDSIRSRIAGDFTVPAITDRVIRAATGEGIPLPTALRDLGNRSPDYNAEAWRARGKVHVPKRVWRSLTPGGRVQALRKLKNAGLSGDVTRLTRRRIWLG
ncbi:MAG: hypothetical protein AB3N23_16490 [Paracoccaceae bacterium]